MLPFMNVWYFLLKIFPRAVQKLGTVPVLVFTFQEEPQAKKICILANSQKAFEATQLIIKNRQIKIVNSVVLFRFTVLTGNVFTIVKLA